MDNIKVTLTPTELGDIIDRAFKLGKMYAADELETTDVQTPAFLDPDKFSGITDQMTKWDEWIESRGGCTLNSGAAKHDILWEAVAMTLRGLLQDCIEY